VAPLLPDDLPRWHPVLVCDAPQAGMLRLAASSGADRVLVASPLG